MTHRRQERTPDRATDMDARATTHGKAAKAATTTHPATGAGDACRRSCESATGRAGDVPAADIPRPELYCQRCGHKWKPRTGGTPPRKCPHCDSPNWNKPTKTYFCYKCKHIWTARGRGHIRGLSESDKCPRCHTPTKIDYSSHFPRRYFMEHILPKMKERARCEKQWATKRMKARKG